MTTRPSLSYRHLGLLFFKMGAQAFGGWSTTVILTKKALVPQFISERELKSMIASAQVMPGATQLLIVGQLGYRLRQFGGTVLAVASYILPSTILTILFSVLYFRLSRGINLTAYTMGLRAGVSGIILANGYHIGRSYVKNQYWRWTLVALALVFQWWLGARVVLILVLYGVGGLLLHKRVRRLSHV